MTSILIKWYPVLPNAYTSMVQGRLKLQVRRKNRGRNHFDFSSKAKSDYNMESLLDTVATVFFDSEKGKSSMAARDPV